MVDDSKPWPLRFVYLRLGGCKMTYRRRRHLREITPAVLLMVTAIVTCGATLALGHQISGYLQLLIIGIDVVLAFVAICLAKEAFDRR
jgi:hypothetical protein